MTIKKPIVVDCSIRDGGLANAFSFSPECVSRVYDLVSDLGVPVIELGYQTSLELLDSDGLGQWRYATDELLRTVVTPKKAQIATMVDVGRINVDDILPKKESIIDWIRVAFYVHQIEEAIDIINNCAEKGYLVSANLMAVSKARQDEPALTAALDRLADSPVSVVYVVDSNGALYPDDVRSLVALYHSLLKGKSVGMHAHNNLQLAFANTIAAVQAGAEYVDVTVNGIGRGAGNCALELWLAYQDGITPQMQHLLQLVQEEILPMKAKGEWGYSIPYLLTGASDEHPRKAIQLRASATPDDYLSLFQSLLKPIS